MIELLAAANGEYFQLFPGDVFFGGLGLAIYWTIKNGAGFFEE
tara:strand:- start:169 stop:297 length:129 start_codon:yes stop_codon:yes gene_type:complete